jgi:hypothetical protein
MLRRPSLINLEQTAVETVQRRTIILEKKGLKHVVAVTSAGRGFLVFTAVAVSAGRNSCPSHFVLPRKSFRDFSNANVPEGSAGSTNMSGWKPGDGFLLYIHGEFHEAY